MLKNIKIVLVALACLSISVTSCQKYDGDSYDFSNKEKNYVRMAKATTQVVVNGPAAVDSLGEVILDSLGNSYSMYAPAEVSIETKMSFTEDITYTYVIELDGFEPKPGSGVLKKGTTSSKILLDYTEEDFPAEMLETEGTIKLTGANGVAYGDLRLGYPKVGSNLSVALFVLKPREP